MWKPDSRELGKETKEMQRTKRRGDNGKEMPHMEN